MIFQVFRENHRNAPANVRQETHKRNQKLYQEARALLPNLPTPDIFAKRVAADLPDIFKEIARDLFLAEGFDIPSPPDPPESMEAARWRDRMVALIATGRSFDQFTQAVKESFAAISIPATSGEYSVPMTDLIADSGKMVEQMVEPLKTPYFAAFREQYDKNCCKLSRLPYSKESLASHRLARPSDADNPFLYLKDTPFERIKDVRVPWGIPEKHHYEGQWILAPQGAGKTTFIEYQIAQLLEKVQRNECSIIVMDSQEELIPRISGLKLFAKGQSLENRLVYINANDVQYPIALSLFDIGLQQITDPLERARMLNTALELSLFMLESILGNEMSGSQSGMFRFLVQAMFAIPDATIHTLKDILRPNGLEQFRPYIETLDRAALDFFNNDFTGKDNKYLDVTKQSIIRRLNTMLSISEWERMFNHPRSKISLYDEMNAGKVILINSAMSLLQKKGVETFGRFFLTLITMAAQRRATLPPHKKVPCHIFIDEVYDYMPAGSDANIQTIIEKCRKQKIALIVSHQAISQLAVKTADTLQTVSIKCTSRLTEKDAYNMARGMRTSASFLESIPQYHFAVYLRDAPKPVTIRIPHGLEKYPRMTQAEADAIRDDMRARYAEPLQPRPYQKSAPAEDPQPPPSRPRRDPDA